MTLIKSALTSLFIAFISLLNAQKPTDLGSTKPFMVGLKGTIYPFLYLEKTPFGERTGYTEDMEKKTPIGYVYTQSLNIPERELTMPFPGVPRGISNFAIIYKGKFEVKEAVELEFVLKSDDGSILWIDSTEVVNHDGLHQFQVPKKGAIKLEKGFHDIKVWYFQGIPTRMGLLLLMKSKTEKEWKPFDLKPFEDEIKQLMKLDSGVVKVQLNEQFLFDLGKSDLKPEAETQLSNVAKLLIIKPNSTLKIDGHTDNKGSSNANLSLSENRANAVANALKKMGIPETIKIETKGFGLTQPIVPNNSEDNRAKNRRVELSISLDE
jgi:outer membrane protein OmpA-like peptidoglycan-associated protein